VNQNVARGAAEPIEAVLQESGVSRGSLYHHFKGKDVLFEAGPGDATAWA
jgi:AcrR family transcriptional regulator